MGKFHFQRAISRGRSEISVKIITLCCILLIKRTLSRDVKKNVLGTQIINHFWPQIINQSIILVKMVQKSEFSPRSRTIPKHDWTSKEQCLAISEHLYCSPNFSTRSDRLLFLTVLMGIIVLSEFRKKLKKTLTNFVRTFR